MAEGKQLPLIVSGMSNAERAEFQRWLTDCCGADYNSMTAAELKESANRWFDEQYTAGEQGL